MRAHIVDVGLATRQLGSIVSDLWASVPQDRPQLRPTIESVTNRCLAVQNRASAADEADLRVEVLLHVQVGRDHLEHVALVRHLESLQAVVTFPPRRSRAGQDGVQPQIPEEDEIGVGPEAAVVVALTGLSVDEHGADVRVGQDVTAEPCHREVVGRDLSLRARLDVHHPEIVGPNAARHPGARQDGHNLETGAEAYPTAEEEHRLLGSRRPDAVGFPELE